MAKIALSIAAVGAAAAAPFTAGSSLLLSHVLMAASVGLSVGASLIQPRPPGQAPLQDLNVSSSANGAAIPFGYGTMRLAGQVIWSPGIIYRVATQSTSSGGTSQSSYVYSASFAAAFGEGPASIARVWADSKLIYKGGAPFGSFAPWSAGTAYVPEDIVSYQWNPGPGLLTALFRCVVPNTDVPPAGASLYWEVASYAFWDSSVQYMPGNEIAYPGLTSEGPQSGQIYACITPSTNDEPDSSPGHWEPLSSYYVAPTLYPGSQTQDPDPLIQGYQGVTVTPAFRGLAYAVWDNMPLANFGNRVPNLRAEVTYGS